MRSVPPGVLRTCALAAALAAAGCSGQIAAGDGDDEPPAPGAPRPPGTAAPGTPGVTPPGQSPAPGVVPPATSPPGTMPAPGTEPPASTPKAPPPPPAPFTCKPADKGAVPRRLWRLTRDQYQNSIATFFSGRLGPRAASRTPPAGLIVPFQGGATGTRFSTDDSPSVSDFEFRWGMESAAWAGQRFVAIHKSNGGNCFTNSATPVTKGCVRQTARDRGPLLFRRPLTNEELDFYENLAKENVAALGEEDAAALAFQAMMMSTAFLYRTELGGAPDGSGTSKLTPHEVASAIALTLTDYPPDEDLWRAAEAGELATPAQVKAQVARLLMVQLARRSDGKLPASGAVTRFLKEYFQYARAADVFKDDKLYRGHDPGALVEETDDLIKDVLVNNGRKDLLKTLLTTNVGYIRNSHNIQTGAFSYGIKDLPPRTGDNGTMRITLPADQRAGVLTQPSFLTGFSVSDANEPVQRGRFVAESLLCFQVPELPIGQVPPLGDLGPMATLRDKLTRHSSDPACWACHRMMDPLGVAFETYDHVGRFRTMEAGRPVDATGALEGIGADGKYANAVEMMQRLGASPVVQQCFVRHAYRYFLGRQEVDGDGCSLVEADQAYKAGGGDLVELLATLLASRSNLQRTAQ